jgi:ABC-type transport system substrate-binding protein
MIQSSGLETPIRTVIRTRDDAAGFLEVAQVVQASLKSIGIDAQIRSGPDSVNSAYVQDPKNKAPMGIVAYSADFPDGGSFLGLFLDPRHPENPINVARFHDPAFYTPFDEAAAAQGASRGTSYTTLDESMMEKAAPWAPLLTPKRFDFVSSRVSNYVYSMALDAVNYNTLRVKG